jgi:hypothetical protein
MSPLLAALYHLLLLLSPVVVQNIVYMYGVVLSAAVHTYVSHGSGTRHAQSVDVQRAHCCSVV